MAYEEPVTDYDKIVENCTCAFCGSNCDDLDSWLKKTMLSVSDTPADLVPVRSWKTKNRDYVPMVRDENGELVEVDWDTALDAAAEL